MGDNLIRIWIGQLWVVMYIVADVFNLNSSYILNNCLHGAYLRRVKHLYTTMKHVHIDSIWRDIPIIIIN